jgi:P-type conjugative transfer protein TrbL
MTPHLFFDLGTLNDILDAFETATVSWVFNLYPAALATFFTLASIELAWSLFRHVLSTSSTIEGLLDLVVRKILAFSFSYYVLYFAPAIIPLILNSFQKAGTAATGIDALRPSTFLAVGCSLAATFLAQANSMGVLLDPFASNVLVVASFTTVALFALMSAIILMTLIESYLLIPCAVFLLPFSATRWTSSITDGLFAHAFALGLRLLLLMLVGGVLKNFLQVWADQAQSSSLLLSPIAYIGFCGQLLCLTLVLWNVPRLARAIIRPTVSLHLTPRVGDN